MHSTDIPQPGFGGRSRAAGRELLAAGRRVAPAGQAMLVHGASLPLRFMPLPVIVLATFPMVRESIQAPEDTEEPRPGRRDGQRGGATHHDRRNDSPPRRR